jgi:hypothetical protein
MEHFHHQNNNLIHDNKLNRKNTKIPRNDSKILPKIQKKNLNHPKLDKTFPEAFFEDSVQKQ